VVWIVFSLNLFSGWLLLFLLFFELWSELFSLRICFLGGSSSSSSSSSCFLSHGLNCFLSEFVFWVGLNCLLSEFVFWVVVVVFWVGLK